MAVPAKIGAWVITCHPAYKWAVRPSEKRKRTRGKKPAHPAVSLPHIPRALRPMQPRWREKGLAAERTLLRARSDVEWQSVQKARQKERPLQSCAIFRTSRLGPPSGDEVHPRLRAAAHASHQSARPGGRSEDARQDRLVLFRFRGTCRGEARREPPALALPPAVQSVPPKCDQRSSAKHRRVSSARATIHIGRRGGTKPSLEDKQHPRYIRGCTRDPRNAAGEGGRVPLHRAATASLPICTGAS